MAQHTWKKSWSGDKPEVFCEVCGDLEEEVGRLSECRGRIEPCTPKPVEHRNPEWSAELSQRMKDDIERMFGKEEPRGQHPAGDDSAGAEDAGQAERS